VPARARPSYRRPIPILKTTKPINEVQPGGTLEVLAIGGRFSGILPLDRRTLVEQTEAVGEYRFLIKKAG
jgi:TusA-related sulfurtransferase